MVACLKVGNLAHSFVYQQIFHELPLCAVAVLARKCSLHLYLQLLIPEAPACRKCQSGHDFTMNQKKKIHVLISLGPPAKENFSCLWTLIAKYLQLSNYLLLSLPNHILFYLISSRTGWLLISFLYLLEWMYICKYVEKTYIKLWISVYSRCGEMYKNINSKIEIYEIEW